MPEAQLEWAYRQAAVVLLPSKLEGFGLPAVEALARGANLVTSEDPALCEVSGDNARHVHTLDEAGWITAVLSVVQSEPSPKVVPIRTWDDVAADLLLAVSDAR